MAADFSRSAIGPLQAPRTHGELLARPDLAGWVELAERNALALNQSGASIGSRKLAEFRTWTREVVLGEARRYVASLMATGAGSETPLQGPVFVAGHQPIFAHPGVWAKNFALSSLSRAGNGTSLNLVVDNDTVERTSIDVPAGTPEGPWFTAIPFDAPPVRQPWEELSLADVVLFESFAGHVAEALVPWKIRPLLGSVWADVVDCSQKVHNVAQLLTTMRVLLERKWGTGNLELPISRLSTLGPFLWFVAHLCRDAERFRDIHNAALVDYRAENGIRNERHPVPPLEKRDEWTELPLWVWRAGDHRRQQLFVRRFEDRMELSNGEQSIGRIDLAADGRFQAAVSKLEELQRTWKIRPRALTTTMFARLALADLFVHGIGGAKYDEVTDRILSRFFNIHPPAYGVLTATLHLPVPAYSVTGETEVELVRKLRDLEFNPHHYLAGEQVIELGRRREELLAEKQELNRDPRSRSQWRSLRGERRRLHNQLKAIREELAGQTMQLRQDVHNDLEAIRRQLAANKVLRSREYAAVLFPEHEIRGLIGRIEQGVIGP